MKEEAELEEQFIETITTTKVEIDALNVELGLPTFHYNGSEKLMIKEAALKREAVRLRGLKEVRMVELYKLKEREEELAHKLSEPQAYVNTERVPTTSDINTLEESIRRLQLLVDERKREYSELTKNVTKNYQIMKKT